jgi:peptidoglycan/xylan/chitin deacetylase (PgdA/CDA1 family)
MKRLIYQAVIGALYHSRVHRLFAAYRGVGAILMFHRVLPAAPAGRFAPNAFLSVTPEFFEAVIRFLLARGYEIVTMSEARRRLIGDGPVGRPFICLSFDDGYRDNLEIALPICRSHGVPMTINITTGLIDGEIHPWWLVFEAALRHTDVVNFSFEGEAFSLRTVSDAEKTAAFARLANAVHRKPPAVQHCFVAAMADSVGFDLRAFHARHAMRWD